MRVINVGDLITVVKAQLKINEVITIHSGSKTLEDGKLVTELYNTKDDAFEIIAAGRGMHNMAVFNFSKPTFISDIFLTCHHQMVKNLQVTKKVIMHSINCSVYTKQLVLSY